MHEQRNKTSYTIYDVIWLSGKQLFKRLPFWIRTNFWFVLLSLAIITMPGAKAALYSTIKAGLRDPGESRVKIEKIFKQTFFKHFWRSLMVNLLNVAIFMVIILSIRFWILQDQLVLNLVSILGIYFFVMWFLCQPFIFPILVNHHEYSIFQIFKQAVLLVIKHPLPAFVFSLTTTFVNLIGIVLLGPIILIVPVFIGMLSMQAYWYLTGEIIPDWIDPVQYQNMLDKNEAKENNEINNGFS